MWYENCIRTAWALSSWGSPGLLIPNTAQAHKITVIYVIFYLRNQDQQYTVEMRQGEGERFSARLTQSLDQRRQRLAHPASDDRDAQRMTSSHWDLGPAHALGKILSEFPKRIWKVRKIPVGGWFRQTGRKDACKQVQKQF